MNIIKKDVDVKFFFFLPKRGLTVITL